MTEKITIITDSGSDIPQGSYPNVTVLPMAIRFGEDEYRDGINLTTRQFYEKLAASDRLPTTSLVSPGAFEDAFALALSNQEKVIAITISGELSGTYQSAVLAAQAYPDDVFVVDSRCVAVGEQALVQRALALIEAGLCARDIAATLDEEKERLHVLAVLDTLEYLKKGGRISAATALIGGALAIKPVVTVLDGKVAMLGKARGSKNGNNYLMKEIEKTNGIDFSKPLCLGYTGLDDTLLQQYIADSAALWRGRKERLHISPIGATIGTHVGPGAIAVAFFANEE